MTSSLTSKGKAWEYRNSLWMLWSLLTFGVFNYISFFYISRKVKQKKWFRAGIVYSVIFIFTMIAPDSLAWLLILGWIASIIHVFKVRTEYLLRLEAMQASGYKKREIDRLKETIAKEYDRPSFKNDVPDPRIDEKAPVKVKSAQIVEAEHKENPEKSYVDERIDINTATEKEIANIPGIGSIFAAKIVTVRNQENGFQSFDHFVHILSVKPHLAERMKSHISFSNLSHNEQRVKKTEGRIVDF